MMLLMMIMMIGAVPCERPTFYNFTLKKQMKSTIHYSVASAFFAARADGVRLTTARFEARVGVDVGASWDDGSALGVGSSSLGFSVTTMRFS